MHHNDNVQTEGYRVAEEAGAMVEKKLIASVVAATTILDLKK